MPCLVAGRKPTSQRFLSFNPQTYGSAMLFGYALENTNSVHYLFFWSISAGQYVAVGNLEWSVYKQNGELSNTDNYSFSVEVGDNNSYRIKVISNQGQYYFDQVTSSDGVDNYFLKDAWPSWAEKREKQNLKEYGFVSPGIFPTRSGRPTQCLWIMFLSKSYFSNVTNNPGLALSDVNYVQASSITNVVQWLDEAPDFVKNFKGFAPNIILGGKQIDLPEAFDKKFPVWEVFLLATTDVANKIFPFEFEYRQYFPKLEQGKNDVARIYGAHFSVSRIQMIGSTSNLLPEIKTNMTVVDYRFEKEMKPADGTPEWGFIYDVKDGQWRSQNNPSVKRQLVEITRINNTGSPVAPEASRSIFLIRIILAFLVFAPALIFVQAWSKRKKTTKEKNENEN